MGQVSMEGRITMATSQSRVYVGTPFEGGGALKRLIFPLNELGCGLGQLSHNGYLTRAMFSRKCNETAHFQITSAWNSFPPSIRSFITP